MGRRRVIQATVLTAILIGGIVAIGGVWSARGDRAASAGRPLEPLLPAPPPPPPTPCAAYATCCADYNRALVWQQLYDQEALGATHDSCAAVAALDGHPGADEACERALIELRYAMEPMERLEGWATPESCR